MQSRAPIFRMPIAGLAAAIGITLAAVLPASAAVLVHIDKSTQTMTVARNGETLYRWPVSTGRRGYDTPNGTFRAFRMEADHFSKEWDDAPMPHSIFFTKIGHAIHGYLDTRNIGLPASHGCVRLTPENAAKLYALVEADGVLNTTVVLTGATPSAAMARRSLPLEDTGNAFMSPGIRNGGANAPLPLEPAVAPAGGPPPGFPPPQRGLFGLFPFGGR